MQTKSCLQERDQYLETIADLARISNKPKTVTPTKDDKHRSRKWWVAAPPTLSPTIRGFHLRHFYIHDMPRHRSYAQLLNVAERRFLFRDVALEVFFGDGRSYLLIFSTGVRAKVIQQLLQYVQTVSLHAPTLLGSSDHRTAGALAKFVDNSALRKACKRWEAREISNFEYLMTLNTHAGRTYNDVTAYPVFPWVIADWESDELDLSKPETFRILSLPMGGQTPERRRAYDRFNKAADRAPVYPL